MLIVFVELGVTGQVEQTHQTSRVPFPTENHSIRNEDGEECECDANEGGTGTRLPQTLHTKREEE